MPTFDPSKHLRTYRRQQRDPKNANARITVETEYLDVRWRVLWIRTEHPDARIATELITHEDGFALFRAVVSLPDGGGSATGWGSETRQDFTDYIEKAETKALGRALAHLGFGTQFATELDEGDQVVDSQIETKARPVKPTPAASTTTEPATSEPTRGQLNARLLKAIETTAFSNRALMDGIRDLYGAVRTGDLSDAQLVDVTAWVNGALDLRYDGPGGKARLVGPDDDGLLSLDDLPLESLAEPAT